MNVVNIIKRAERKGIYLTTDGDKLKVIYEGDLPSDIQENLKKYKSELISFLRNRTEPPALFVIKSNLLGENIVFRKGEDVNIPKRYQNCTCYTYKEARELLKAGDKDVVQDAHLIKKMFDGKIVS